MFIKVIKLLFKLTLILLINSEFSYAEDMVHKEDTVHKKDDAHYLQVVLNAYKANDFLTLKATKKKFYNSSLVDFAQWLYLTHEQTPASLSSIYEFLLLHPDWPKASQLITNGENKLSLAQDPKFINKWCKKFPPQNGNAIKICLLNQISSMHDLSSACNLIKQAWVKGSFTQDESDLFIKKYTSCISKKDYVQKIDYLIWQNKLTSAKSLMHAINNVHVKNRFKKRLQILEGKKVAINDDEIQNHGIAYAMIQSYIKNKKDKAIDEVLLKINYKALPYPEKWWPIINARARDAIINKKYKIAYKLIKNHNLKPGEKYSEAEWLAGWLSLRFLNQPKEAEAHFLNFYNNVNYSISKARAKYWLARTYEAQKLQPKATEWYLKASSHQHTFYGQLALAKLNKANFNLTYKTKISDEKIQQIRKNPLYKISKELLKANADQLAIIFLKKLALSQNKQLSYVSTALGISEFKRKHVSVEVAKHAAQNSFVFPDLSYPKVFFAEGWVVDKSLIHSIIRQESMFNQYAKSPAGALGLMQLMPRTAQQIANKHSITYHHSRLTSDPLLNLQIGQYYLKYLLKIFNNNMVLTVASYNAGIGNVRKWLDQIGDPRELKTIEELVDWMEHVPFAETRNYIQRVIENYHIYHHLFKKNNTVTVEYSMLNHKNLSEGINIKVINKKPKKVIIDQN
ncbi:lytic transglycosylase domain-containing protein [Rickettsiales endosymbiont of Stachyamoeba lipophora]|uniref:lytic transglycosylase domain-containing protein n=1 Tax=Rickettsiales endosymbiont of Stachyamoeba lipophora TaxID=2486578 RepID=UPI000F64E7AD|nr:lytic transglycosylase domain-containing protein [Rickettsiales endosymbiont of Stachyamoeba lipophora]AZL15709.1 lytic transglycosylase domain-containing protein [Rickettsiales endosymbiont of Stachyamoeba lipophora]